MSKALQKQLIESATGKGTEPTWSPLATISKMELATALNYYNINSDERKRKEWATAWAKKNNRPDFIDKINKSPLWLFWTYPVLARIEMKGGILEERHRQSMIEWFESLGPRREETDEAPKIVRVRRQKVNANQQAYDNALDDAVDGKDPVLTLDADVECQGIINSCNMELEAIKEDSSIYPKHMKAWFKKVLEKATALKKAADKKKVVAPPKVRKIDPLKMVRDVNYQRKDETLGLSSINPATVVGAKRVYVYNTKYREIIRYYSSAASGFEFSGTTLLNVDLEKSGYKVVRKPEGLIKDKMGIRELDKLFNELATKEGKLEATRINNNTVFLVAS